MIISQIHIMNIFDKNNKDIYSKICTAAPTNRAVNTNDSIRTKAIIALANNASFSRGLRDKASKKHPKTTPVASAAMLTGNIIKAKTKILAAFTRNTSTLTLTKQPSVTGAFRLIQK